jgi:hypothetical protein
MKKILLSLAAIFVALSSFAAKELIVTNESGYSVIKYDANYALYYAIVRFNLKNEDYIDKANEAAAPADENFNEVKALDNVWKLDIQHDDDNDGLQWDYFYYKNASQDTYTQNNTYSASSVASRSTDIPHYVLYLQLRGDDKTTVVAENKYSINDDTMTGKIDLTVDENAAVEVYNLSGVRMQGDNLPAGVYIRRQGNKVSKYVVR